MPRLAPALAGLLLAAAPAAADVTPREVWDDWMAAVGEDTDVSTESIEEGGGRLVVRGLAMAAGSEEDGRYSVEVDEIVLVQNDDGTVGVTVSPQYPIVLTDVDEDGTRRQTRLLVQHPDLAMTVTEDAGLRAHAFSAPEIRVSVEEALAAGEPLDLDGGLVLTDAAGRYDIRDTAAAESAFSASEVAVTFTGTDPEEGATFDLELGMQGLESTNMLQLAGPGTAALARELPEGASRAGSFRTEAGSFGFTSESEGETIVLSGTAGPSETDISVSPEGLSYASEGVDAAITVSGDTIPLPEIVMEIGTAASTFAVPLLADEEPQPYAFEVSMLDVTLDEGLWNMVDPAGILPRDPGAVVIDVSGEMMVEDDVDATGVDGISGVVETLSLDAVRLAFADAEVVATGLLDLPESPGGEEMPVGQVEVVLTGAAQLLERLVQAGIVPQDQAMGAQMMLGMFATPGAGDDVLVSRIRFAEDGGVFVNDQQVR